MGIRCRWSRVWLLGSWALALPSLAAQEITWQASLSQALQAARQGAKLVLVDVYTDWCHWCKVMEEKTYADSRVAQALRKDFVAVKVNPEKDQAFAKRYPVSAFPTTLFLDEEGMVIHRIEGFQAPEEFLSTLKEAQQRQVALRQAQEALAKDAKNIEANAVMARFFLQNQAPEKAQTHVDRILQADPEDKRKLQVDLLLSLGVAYGRARQFDKAIATLKRVVAHPAAQGQAREAEGWYFLGLAYLMDGKQEEGRSALERARQHPKAPQALRQQALQILQRLAPAQEPEEGQR